MFLRTKDINEKTVYSAIDKLIYTTRPNKYSSETINSIISHINLFPRKESHCLVYHYFFSCLCVCTQRQFLCVTLNRFKMYRLYKEWLSNNPDYQNVAPANQKSEIIYSI
jgi:hypothetical protein